MLKIKLNRNLRKSIKQGHPWLYRNAITEPNGISDCQICKVVDQKNNILAWGYYDPHSVLAVRILSTESKPPNNNYFVNKIKSCIDLRTSYFDLNSTNAFRLLNGEGDGLPGLVCDVYGQVAILQTDGKGPGEFWPLDVVAEVILSSGLVKSVYHKARGKDEISLGTWGEPLPEDGFVLIKENNVIFNVDFVTGQKTGFFLDQRDNRDYLKSWCKAKSVVNLFSYTGGFSIYAGLGGASNVTSVDISPKAIELCNKNWEDNTINGSHEGVCADVFKFIEESPKKFDIVMVDPPSMAHSEKQKETAIKKYTELFANSASLLNKDGHLFLSSCSSHINFEDFYSIACDALSAARLKGKVLRYSSQGIDHPYLHICPEQRYLKFLHIKITI